MSLSSLDKALQPYGKKLCTQERLRRLLGVKEVDSPTYEKYITGPIERFERQKNIFNILHWADNPFGKEFRERFKKITGYDNRLEALKISFEELESPADRIGMSLNKAVWRLCRDHHPETLPVTSVDGRVEVQDRAWMTQLIKKVALFLGAEMVKITRYSGKEKEKG